MSTGRPGGKADEVSVGQGVLPVGCAHDDGAVDDEKPFLLVLVVVRGAALSRRQVAGSVRTALGEEPETTILAVAGVPGQVLRTGRLEVWRPFRQGFG